MSEKQNIQDADRIEYLERLFYHCPHAKISCNDDEDEGPIGWTVVIEGCETTRVFDRTFKGAIDQLIAIA